MTYHGRRGRSVRVHHYQSSRTTRFLPSSTSASPSREYDRRRGPASSLAGKIVLNSAASQLSARGAAYDQILQTDLLQEPRRKKSLHTCAGITVEPDGRSHQMLEMQLMRGLPGMNASFPADYWSANRRCASPRPRPALLHRLGRAKVPTVYDEHTVLEAREVLRVL